MRSKFWDFNREIRIQLSRKRGAGRGPSFVLWWKLAKVGNGHAPGCSSRGCWVARPGLLIQIRSLIGWDPDHLPYPDRDRHPGHAYPESSDPEQYHCQTPVFCSESRLKPLKKWSNKLIFHLSANWCGSGSGSSLSLWYRSNADPDSDFYLMRMRMRIRIWMRRQIFIWCGCGSGCRSRSLKWFFSHKCVERT